MESDADGLKILKTIKDLVVNFQSQKYLPLALDESKARFCYCIGRANMLRHNVGTIGDEPGVVSMLMAKRNLDMATIPPDDLAAIMKDARDQCLTMSFLARSDRYRYGQKIEDLENDFLQGQDNYPKTVR
eukprot:scaffold114476_cov36-Attheya_sp.AAC.2